MFARAVPVAFDDEGVGVVSRYSGGIRTQLHRPIGPLEYGFRSYQQGHDETQPPRRSISVQQSEVRSNPDLGSTKKRVPCELTRFSSGLDWNSTRRHVEQPINRGGPSATGKRMIFGDEKAIHQVLDFTHSERRHGYVHEAPTLPVEEKFKSNRPIPYEASSTGNLHTHEPFSKQESPFKSPFRTFYKPKKEKCKAHGASLSTSSSSRYLQREHNEEIMEVELLDRWQPRRISHADASVSFSFMDKPLSAPSSIAPVKDRDKDHTLRARSSTPTVS